MLSLSDVKKNAGLMRGIAISERKLGIMGMPN
jgi:hypothetical protein